MSGINNPSNDLGNRVATRWLAMWLESKQPLQRAASHFLSAPVFVLQVEEPWTAELAEEEAFLTHKTDGDESLEHG